MYKTMMVNIIIEFPTFPTARINNESIQCIYYIGLMGFFELQSDVGTFLSIPRRDIPVYLID